MLEDILRFQCGLDPQKSILVGVSGGPDSLCLLDILCKSGYSVIVAHFNHELRPEADLEEAAVSKLASSLGHIFERDSADVRAYAEGQKLSVEEAARFLRYSFLFKTARRYIAQAVAVGHTADDQVETVLMHFLRGAGLAGLKGMEYRTILPVFDPEIPLVRPLLSLWRNDTESYCRKHKLRPHYDASNADQSYLRNRLRQSLIPDLEKYNPHFKESLQRMALALQGDYSVLQDTLDNLWNEVVFSKGDGWIAFDAAALARLRLGLLRNIIRHAAVSLRPFDRDFSFEAVERAVVFIKAPTRKKVEVENGLHLFSESGRIYLAASEADLPSSQWPQVDQTLHLLSHELKFADGWILTREEYPQTTKPPSLTTDNWAVWLDADRAGDTLIVRPPLPGDRFQPLGMQSGSMKLSDLFVNQKLPRRARRHWPVICAGEQIVWVPGLHLAHPFRVTEDTRRIFHLVLKKT